RINARINANIEAQIKVMEKNCELCKKPMNVDLFPASMTLEKISGISKYPYESDIVSSFDLHVRQCVCERVFIHQHCSSLFDSTVREDEYFYPFDSRRCNNCDKSMLNTDILQTAMKCLLNSTKSYEFAYIYKTLKKYEHNISTVILITSMEALDTAEEIKKKIEKCSFKGKRSMLASLDLYKICLTAEPSVDILCNFLQYSLGDVVKDKSSFWSHFMEEFEEDEQIREFLMKSVYFIREEHVEKKFVLCRSLIYTALENLSHADILTLISGLLLSEKYFLLSTLQEATVENQFATLNPECWGAQNLPNTFTILSIVENDIRDATKSILLSGTIDKRAEAVAKCISAKPWVDLENEYAPIFIYLKRLYKLKSKSSTNKKKEILFYENLIMHLLVNMNEVSKLNAFYQGNELITFLKVCIFYRIKYKNIASEQSPFIAYLFELIDAYESAYDSDYESEFESEWKTKIHLPVDERREVMALRAMNCNINHISDQTLMDLLDSKDTQILLAERFIKRGRSMMQEGIEYVPLIIKNNYTPEEYRQFLYDLCHSTHLPYFTLRSVILEDLSSLCKDYPVTEMGFLPLLPSFYELLDCEEWLEEDVLEWCEKANFIAFLNEHLNTTDEEIKFKFVRRHFRMILRYVLETAGNNGRVEAELVAKCWRICSDKVNDGCEGMIYNDMAGEKNGYFHANIYFLLNRKELGQEIGMDVMAEIHGQHVYDNSEMRDVIELQKKFIEYIKAWEETDIALSCDSKDISVQIRTLYDKLEEIRGTRLPALFKEIVENSNAILKLEKVNSDFYEAMAEALDFIPEAAMALNSN
ncbi:hypothetical protein ENBRE01_2916, partial [Enteropsectra breve]